MSEDLQECQICFKRYTTKSGNLKRHMIGVHKMTYEKPKNKVSVKNVDNERVRGRKRTTDFVRSKTTEYMFGNLSPAVATAISVAVYGLLEQQDQYNVEDLSKFVSENHELVPDDVVEYIVVAATSAAWHVARKFYVREQYMNSSRLQHQELAENVGQSMLAWFSGLRPRRGNKVVMQEIEGLIGTTVSSKQAVNTEAELPPVGPIQNEACQYKDNENQSKETESRQVSSIIDSVKMTSKSQTEHDEVSNNCLSKVCVEVAASLVDNFLGSVDNSDSLYDPEFPAFNRKAAIENPISTKMKDNDLSVTKHETSQLMQTIDKFQFPVSFHDSKETFEKVIEHVSENKVCTAESSKAPTHPLVPLYPEEEIIEVQSNATLVKPDKIKPGGSLRSKSKSKDTEGNTLRGKSRKYKSKAIISDSSDEESSNSCKTLKKTLNTTKTGTKPKQDTAVDKPRQTSENHIDMPIIDSCKKSYSRSSSVVKIRDYDTKLKDEVVIKLVNIANKQNQDKPITIDESSDSDMQDVEPSSDEDQAKCSENFKEIKTKQPVTEVNKHEMAKEPILCKPNVVPQEDTCDRVNDNLESDEFNNIIRWMDDELRDVQNRAVNVVTPMSSSSFTGLTMNNNEEIVVDGFQVSMKKVGEPYEISELAVVEEFVTSKLQPNSKDNLLEQVKAIKDGVEDRARKIEIKDVSTSSESYKIPLMSKRVVMKEISRNHQSTDNTNGRDSEELPSFSDIMSYESQFMNTEPSTQKLDQRIRSQVTSHRSRSPHVNHDVTKFRQDICERYYPRLNYPSHLQERHDSHQYSRWRDERYAEYGNSSYPDYGGFRRFPGSQRHESRYMHHLSDEELDQRTHRSSWHRGGLR